MIGRPTFSCFISTGEVEYWMLSELSTSFAKIANLSIEPNAEELSKYKQLIQTNKSKLSGITFAWNQQTLTEFQKASESSAQSSMGFHLITAIHSLYYEPLESALQYLYGCLAGDGILVVALDSGT